MRSCLNASFDVFKVLMVAEPQLGDRSATMLNSHGTGKGDAGYAQAESREARGDVTRRGSLGQGPLVDLVSRQLWTFWEFLEFLGIRTFVGPSRPKPL